MTEYLNEQLPAFEYLGRKFQPYSTQDGCKWIIERGRPMRLTMNGYDHTAFYQAAACVGASRHNIFLLEGFEVMPCASDLLAFRQF